MYFFLTYSKLTSIEGLEYLDTSRSKDLSLMFSGCSSLEKLDVSSLNTSNAVDMRGMFGYMDNIVELNVSNLNTSKAENLYGMFSGDSKLQRIIGLKNKECCGF